MRVFGTALQFPTPESMAHATRILRDHGFTRLEAYTPFPVEELEDLLHPKKSPLPLIALIAGVLGALGAFYMQYYYSVQQYPHNVGGRPFFSWQAFVPVIFELTILASGFAVFIAFFAIARLPEPHHPLFAVSNFARVSDDRFFICLHASDPLFNESRTRSFLESLGAEEVFDVPT